MASLFSKIATFMRSPQGRRLTQQVKHMAKPAAAGTGPAGAAAAAQEVS